MVSTAGYVHNGGGGGYVGDLNGPKDPDSAAYKSVSGGTYRVQTTAVYNSLPRGRYFIYFASKSNTNSNYSGGYNPGKPTITASSGDTITYTHIGEANGGGGYHGSSKFGTFVLESEATVTLTFNTSYYGKVDYIKLVS